MTKTSNFLVLLLFVAVGYFQVGCKSTTATTKLTAEKPETVASVEEDTTEPAPINLGSTATTTTSKVDEGKSGMDVDLPFSPEVRTGTLDNGMRYYIRKNAKPANRLELRLAVNAGSMQEEDDQLGLAHFVEHMAFNGTTNFKKNELIDFLEATGVRFGADLNAYTSFDETVYMLQLPTDKEGLVDKGLTVMSDWATGIAFEEEEIDKERGVIQSEWRTGLGANRRMRQVWWPKVFYETRYADRLPIGTVDIIQNAPYDRFRSFYKDWYRPNLQAIIVVGDLDVEEMEKKIIAKFKELKNPENPKEKIEYKVPGHKETFVAIATDKEATSSSIQVYIKHDADRIKTLDDFRTSLMHDLYDNMFNDRFSELTQKKESPFLDAGVGYGDFVRTKDAYYIGAQAKEGKILESLEAAMKENQRVLLHGFTDTELERQKLALKKAAERAYKESDKITSARLARECVSHFLDKEPLFGAEKEVQLIKEFLPTIKLEEVNALAKEWIIDQNRAIVVTAPEGSEVPTEEEIRKVLDASKEMKPEPYKDKFLDMPLMEKEPTAGKVVTTKTVDTDEVGVTEMTLSNGVRVIMKPTEFQNDQIMLTAYSPGGHSIYSDEDYYTALYAAGIVDEAGLGKFDQIALEKKLTGQTISISPYIGELYEGFSGYSSVEDFETMLKLVHLYATNPRKDKESFERVIADSKEEIKNLDANPMMYFQTEIMKKKHSNHPRRKVVPSMEDLDGIDYERVYEIYNDRFSDFSDFTFVLVGNFKPEDIKPELEQYIASLPSKNRKENWKDVGVEYPTKGSNTPLKKGLAPQANVYMGFVMEDAYTPEKAHRVNTMASILNIMVRENLREDKGGVYSPYVGGGMRSLPTGVSDVTVFFQCAPEDVEDLVEAVKEEIKSLQEKGPSQENFEKVLETQRRGRESDLEKNRFWMNTLSSYYKKDRDLGDIKGYEKLIENITKEDIQKAAKQFLDLDKALILNVKPEKEMPATDGKP